jgi:hypothetical protein
VGRREEGRDDRVQRWRGGETIKPGVVWGGSAFICVHLWQNPTVPTHNTLPASSFQLLAPSLPFARRRAARVHCWRAGERLGGWGAGGLSHRFTQIDAD